MKNGGDGVPKHVSNEIKTFTECKEHFITLYTGRGLKDTKSSEINHSTSLGQLFQIHMTKFIAEG
jgi:hypothetical protein